MEWSDPTGSSGSGTFDSFVRIQADGTEQGYNTDSNQKPFDEKGGVFTKGVKVGRLPVITISGTTYIEIFLDINETQKDGKEYISLDAIKVFQSDSGSLKSTDLSDGGDLGTLVYDLDAGSTTPGDAGDYEVLLYTFNGGSGDKDYRLLIPLWSGYDVNKYFTFYTHFGSSTATLTNHSPTIWSSDSGFEEWSFSHSTPQLIPEPSSFALLGLLFVGVIGFRYFRRPKTVPAE